MLCLRPPDVKKSPLADRLRLCYIHSVDMADAIIETPRLILRHFVESDLDGLAVLMTDPDFMRFSTGIFSRKQTANFLFDRIIAPARQGYPSQFAVIFREENRLIGYCGFFRQL